jgi:hypothetical protein
MRRTLQTSRPLARPLARSLLLITALAALPACSSDDNGAIDGGAIDSSLIDGGVSDNGSGDSSVGDAAPGDTTTSQDGGLPATCDATCAKQTLTAVFGTVTEGFERAIYGIDTTGAQPTLYIEALSGGFSGCPKQDSPTQSAA